MLVFISDYIKLNVAKILREENISEDDFHIVHGEDCFSIVITGKSEIFSDMVETVRKCFDNQIILIKVDDGNIVLDVHIFDGCSALYEVIDL